MTFFTRPLGALAPAAARSLRLALPLAVVMAAVLAMCTSDAGAVVTKVESTEVGLQPRNEETVIDGDVAREKEGGEEPFFSNPAPATFANNAGNPVLHEVQAYAVYWDPTDTYHGDWQHLINGFLQRTGNNGGSLNSIFAIQTQYTDASNRHAADHLVYRGSYTDTEPFPGAGCTDPQPLKESLRGKNAITCVTDAQLREELQRFITNEALPTGMNTLYYVLTPPGVTVCLTGAAKGHCSDFKEESEESYEHSFCSYHAAINPDAVETGDSKTVLYAAIPWTAGGVGDGRLAPEDQTEATECQDGGFDPSTGEAPESPQNVQEPNQTPTCPSSDGYCDQGLADLIINQIAVETQNAVTNPLLHSWQDVAKNESSDECRNFFAPILGGDVKPPDESGAGTLFNQTILGGNYYLQMGFNLGALRVSYPGIPCVPADRFEPEFTSPSPVNAGETVAFDGLESDITLNAGVRYAGPGEPQPTYASYTWNFGDGSPTVTGFAPGAPDPTCAAPWLTPCAGSEFHSYTYGGTYNVTLTVTDVGGHTTAISHPVTVVGPPPPGSGSGSGGSGSGSGSGSGGTGSSNTTGTGGSTGPGGSTVAKRPVAAVVVLTRSLKTALKHGMQVSYSVDQQVAGHVEVLMSRATARRLHITAPAASSLAAGSSPQVVVAKAFIRTTKGGRSKLVLVFSSKTAKRLAHQRSLSLLLRLFVRNSANQPATVLTAFSLSH